MAYNLEQLGPTGFQDLAAALAVSVFGPGVQVMGAGRDGGRDMYYKGAMTWSAAAEGEAAEVWNGYTVFQVKHKARLSSRPEDDASWLWGQVRSELDDWANGSGNRMQVPDQMVVVSNVPLSPTPGSGGHDSLLGSIRQYIAKLADSSRDIGEGAAEVRETKLARLSRIKKWRFWDGNQLQTLICTQHAVRRAFPAFLTAADVFANLGEFTDKLPLTELEPGLRTHARSTLMGEGLIYFDEAGSDTTGFPVHEVATDLPVTVADGTQRSSAIRYVLERAEHMLKPNVTTQPRPRHLVLTGAPGNGKTTLSKFLVQVFRAAMLDGAADLSADQKAVITGTRVALERIGLGLPRHRRWPMRIDLAEYVQEGGLESDSTLLKWISHKVSKRLDAGTVSATALQSWMKQWPWFLVLDGLDEVTEPSIRKRLIQQVTEFVNEAEAENCDVLVILTTRPVGYTEHIAPTQFEQIDLDYLDLREAVRYGTLATQVRLGADSERIDKVVARLRAAAEDEALQNLLRTPLQVLILTIIIDGAGQLAPDRYSLFWNYYDTVFKRERSKTGSLQRLLRDHAQQIQQLHERVGFELQVRSEAGNRSFATLSYDELRGIAWSILDEGGFKPSGTDSQLLKDILTAAMQRLVLIVPRGNEGYGFDVRSLQELTAAMFLTAVPLEDVTGKLRLAAASPHWRNAWIFAAGRLFSSAQAHQQEAVVKLIESIDLDAERRLGAIVPIGPRLALEIIDDGMARALPKLRSRLITHGLRVLLEPASPDLPAIVRILVRFADTGTEQSHAVSEGIRNALEGRSVVRETALAVQKLIPAIVEEVGAGQIAKEPSRALIRPNAVIQPEPVDGWQDFGDELLTSPIDPSALSAASTAATALRRVSGEETIADADLSAILTALEDRATARTLQTALSHVVQGQPDLELALRNSVLPALYRQAIGEALRG